MSAARSLIGLAVLAVGLSACEQEEQSAQLAPVEQPAEEAELAVTEGGPTDTVREFFSMLRQAQTAEAAAYISRDLLVVSESEMLDSLDLWADEVAIGNNEYSIVDSYRENGYAMVIARFHAPETPESEVVLRPVVLVEEQGAWKVVWDLLGKEPDQVAVGGEFAEEVAPLYRWYEEREQALNEAAAGVDAS